MTSQSARHAYAPQFYICQRVECQVTRETFICEKIVRQHCKNRTPYALRARSLLRVLGHAGAVVLRAAVSHTSYALVLRLGVDIPFTHSPSKDNTAKCQLALRIQPRASEVVPPTRHVLAMYGSLLPLSDRAARCAGRGRASGGASKGWAVAGVRGRRATNS